MAQRIDYRRMKPIWYFVGLILVSMGAVINLTGLVDLFTGRGGEKVLGFLYTNVWWGELMVLAGALFIIFNRKKGQAPVKKSRKTNG